MARPQSKGTCSLCGKELVRSSMRTHLKSCVKKHPEIEPGKPPRPAVRLTVVDRYGGTYWLSLLADAEAMCSRVGIVAGGKLVAAGAVAEMVPFRIRGWDLVLAGVTADGAAALSARGASAILIGDGRYHVVVPPATSSDEAVALARSIGAVLVSINPVRDTLEDFFLAHVQQSPGRSFD